MGCRQSGQVAATAVAAQRWMQAWQNACQHGSTPAGCWRGPKQMGQVSPGQELLAAPGAAGSCLDASSAAAGTWCPVRCWRDLMSRLLLAGLDGCRWRDSKAWVPLAGLGGSRPLAGHDVWRAVGRTRWLGCCPQDSTSRVPLAVRDAGMYCCPPQVTSWGDCDSLVTSQGSRGRSRAPAQELPQPQRQTLGCKAHRGVCFTPPRLLRPLSGSPCCCWLLCQHHTPTERLGLAGTSGGHLVQAPAEGGPPRAQRWTQHSKHTKA